MRLDPADAVPSWVWDVGEVVSVTRTADELSIVCSAAAAGEADDVVGPYTAFVVDERLDFGLTGVLAALLEPLAQDEVSILALSTYDTDWVLVPAESAEVAARAWRRHGHRVIA